MNEIKEVNNNFLNMVISERKPIGKFISKIKGGYVAVDNSEGEAFTEEFVHLKTALRWLSDVDFEYYTEIDKQKYAELDG